MRNLYVVNGKLGINGFGRIGKLFLRKQLAKKDFSEIVINTGRNVGTSLQSFIDSVLDDTTYGSLSAYLFGNAYGQEVSSSIIDEARGIVEINGVKITLLTQHRNPKDILWGEVSLVVDTTGEFNDPNRDANHPQGSVRGHLLSSNVKKVIVSSPFKLASGEEMPDDVVTVVRGINDQAYNPEKHVIISNASCTTTCLAHMLKPLVSSFGAKNLKSMFMRTVHARTGKQVVLDRLPREGDSDPVKFRATDNNFFISTTGATKTLPLVMPEIGNIPFPGLAIRIPTATGSLVALDANWLTGSAGIGMDFSPEDINQIYKSAAMGDQAYLSFSEKRHVSSDIVGRPYAAIIEGVQTAVIESGPFLLTTSIYGWYDNELGYVDMLAEQVCAVDQKM